MKLQSSKKQTYKKPVLQQHGSIKNLTKSGSQAPVGSDGSCPEGFGLSFDGNQCIGP